MRPGGQSGEYAFAIAEQSAAMMPDDSKHDVDNRYHEGQLKIHLLNNWETKAVQSAVKVIDRALWSGARP